MATTPIKTHNRDRGYKTPKKHETPSSKTQTSKTKVLQAVVDFEDNVTESSEGDEPVLVLVEDSDDGNTLNAAEGRRRSSRVPSPNKRYANSDFVVDAPIVRSSSSNRKRNSRRNNEAEVTDEEDDTDTDFGGEGEITKPKAGDLQLLQDEVGLAGKVMFGFNTPKKKGGMALAAMNTPKTPATPKTPKTPGRLGKTPDNKRVKKSLEPKTPSHVRHKVKNRKFFFPYVVFFFG